MVDRWQTKDANLKIDKKAFFGIFYEDNSRSFKFSVGDRLQINELAVYVRKIVDNPEPNAGIQHFAPPIEEVKKKSINQQVDQYFGFNRKAIVLHELESDSKMDCNMMKSLATNLKQDLSQKLFDYVVKVLLKHGITQSKVDTLRGKQIVVTIDNDRISGKFPCVLCKKLNRSFVAQCSQKNGQYYWNLSNYVRHVTNHFKSKKANKENKNSLDTGFDNSVDFFDELDTSIADVDMMVTEQLNTEDVEEYVKILDSGVNSNDEENKVEDIQNHSIELKVEVMPDDMSNANYVNEIYNQISVQMTKMNEAVLTQNEEELDMDFTVSDTKHLLKITAIPKDNSCLFGALSHQLYREKVASEQHNLLTNQMRADVVEHIEHNIESYEHVLKGRIYDENNGKPIKNIRKACKIFLEKSLSNEITWGGAETTTAIFDMKGVNILIINEQGTSRFVPNGFDKRLTQTVVLAFRVAGRSEKKRTSEISNDDRDHYDSVVRMEQNDIFNLAKVLASTECKRYVTQKQTIDLVT